MAKLRNRPVNCTAPAISLFDISGSTTLKQIRFAKHCVIFGVSGGVQGYWCYRYVWRLVWYLALTRMFSLILIVFGVLFVWSLLKAYISKTLENTTSYLQDVVCHRRWCVQNIVCSPCVRYVTVDTVHSAVCSPCIHTGVLFARPV